MYDTILKLNYKLAEKDLSFIQGKNLSSVDEFDAEKLNSSLSEFEVDEDFMDTVSVDTNISTPYSSRWATSSCCSEPTSFFNPGSNRTATSKTSLVNIKSHTHNL
ncbi:unnamed protein product [Oikopleura dioica]|uniref:Uncharacterized protein n=1 Tax=Oikopleura dioica TaxID=34765 RepID=E4WR76_OIKDI|nr:unnamed protein product [Oikopleura dioica]